VSEGAVVDDVVNHRFAFGADDEEAELVYRRNGRRLVLVHTGVPRALRGRGVGGRLVAAAVERARQEGLVVVPVCPYARRWLEDHPDVAAGVSVDWPPVEPESDVIEPEEDSRHG
jgi:predicted GNAT family acetyltransferase